MKSQVLEETIPKSRSGLLSHSVLQNVFFLALVDLAIGFVAYCLAWTTRMTLPLPLTSELLTTEQWYMVSHPWILLGISQIFFLYIFGLYDDLRVTRYREIAWFIFVVCGLQVVTITSVFYLTNINQPNELGVVEKAFPKSVILLFDVLNFTFLWTWRSHLKTQLKKKTLRVLIVGEGSSAARDIIQEIEKNPWMGLKIIGVALNQDRINGTDPAFLSYPVLGNLEAIQDVIVRYNIEEIIFASEESWKDRVVNSISQLQEQTPVQIAILPSVYEIIIGKLRHVNIHDTPLIEVKRKPNEPFERSIKRLFDAALSAACLLVLSPVFLAVAVLIEITSPGSVFYLQERVGYGQRRFRLVKFRTMIPNAERLSGEKLATVDDPRVTPIGRLLRRSRIDELPQLINVLKGDMSFVGPRPERPGFVKAFEKDVPGYHERHKVKPGLTGLAQVRGYYHTTPENKLKYDLAYIYNYSFSLDLLILLETIKTVLIRRGS